MNRNKLIFIGAGVIVLILVTILIVMSATGNNKKTTTDPNANTLIIWGFDTPSVFDEIIAGFQETYPGYKITYIQKNPTSYATDSLNEIAAGKGPDIWAIPNSWLPKYHDKLIPMPDNLLADKKTKKNDIEVYQTLFPRVVVSDNVIENKIYGMPITIDTLVLYYNPAILQKTLSDYAVAHPDDDNSAISQLFSQGPRNWDDFVTMTKLITKKNGTNLTQSAVALGTANNVARSSDILTLMMLQDGAKMTTDDLSAAQFHTKQNIFGGEDFPGAKALNFYAGFSNPASDLYTWNNDQTDSVRAFATGKTAMMFDYTEAKADIKRIAPDLEFEYFAMPQVRETKNPLNFARYMTYTVTKASTKSNLAWQFITTMTNSNQDSTYLSKTQSQSAKLLTLTDNSDITAVQALNAQNWYVPDPDQTPQIFKDTIKQVNDGKAVQTAIEYAASQVTSLLVKLK